IISIFLLIGNCGEKDEKSSTKKTETNQEDQHTTLKKLDKDYLATVTESLVMRSGAGKDFKKVECFENSEDYNLEQDKEWSCHSGGCTRHFTTLKAGEKVHIIESGETPVKVDKWTNYWYKVSFHETAYSCYEAESGVWVFGEFLK
ncbi:MAG: hypothetical protein KDK36_08715, partial [Leptospiraceae bacterium]|nr:hypothetical protein [Leptospiraceae bacterium]